MKCHGDDLLDEKDVVFGLVGWQFSAVPVSEFNVKKYKDDDEQAWEKWYLIWIDLIKSFGFLPFGISLSLCPNV